MVKFYVPFLGMLTIIALFYDSEANPALYYECIKNLFTQLQKKINEKDAKIVDYFENCMNSETRNKEECPDIEACGKDTLDTFKVWIAFKLIKSEFQEIVTKYENLLKTKAKKNKITILYDLLDEKLAELKNEIPERRKEDITERVEEYNNREFI